MPEVRLEISVLITARAPIDSRFHLAELNQEEVPRDRWATPHSVHRDSFFNWTFLVGYSAVQRCVARAGPNLPR